RPEIGPGDYGRRTRSAFRPAAQTGHLHLNTHVVDRCGAAAPGKFRRWFERRRRELQEQVSCYRFEHIADPSRNAPDLGTWGEVGGPFISLTDLARNAASAAVRILGGETPSGVTSAPLEQSRAIYDWRELNRLGIREQALTPNSIIRFREPTIWDQYRWYFVA